MLAAKNRKVSILFKVVSLPKYVYVGQLGGRIGGNFPSKWRLFVGS